MLWCLWLMLTLQTALESGESSGSLLGWLLSQSAVVVALGLWIWTLLRERSALAKANELLSQLYTQSLERHSVERLKMIDDFALRSDSSVRALLEFFSSLVRGRESLHSAVTPLPRFPEGGTTPPPRKR